MKGRCIKKLTTSFRYFVSIFQPLKVKIKTRDVKCISLINAFVFLSFRYKIDKIYHLFDNPSVQDAGKGAGCPWPRAEL